MTPLVARALATGEPVYLHPGQLVAADKPVVVSTVLGSCVAVCLWDERLKIGGINHYLLPVAPRGSESPRYADTAIPQLVAQVRALGSMNGSLVAKVFGGACVIEAFAHHREQLGQRNIEVARTLLAKAGVKVVAEDVGGRRGRKLFFSLADGSVAVKAL